MRRGQSGPVGGRLQLVGSQVRGASDQDKLNDLRSRALPSLALPSMLLRFLRSPASRLAGDFSSAWNRKPLVWSLERNS